jgi:hypothetical protein
LRALPADCGGVVQLSFSPVSKLSSALALLRWQSPAGLDQRDSLNLFLESGTWRAASQRLLRFAIQETQSAYGFLGVVLGESVLRILAYDGIPWDARINRDLYEEKIRQHREEGYFEITHVGNLLGQVIAKGLTVIANSPSSDPRSGGLPPEHPPLSAFSRRSYLQGPPEPGYAEDLPEAKLPPNSVFIQKPFRFATLLEQLKLVQRKV